MDNFINFLPYRFDGRPISMRAGCGIDNTYYIQCAIAGRTRCSSRETIQMSYGTLELKKIFAYLLRCTSS